MTDASADALNKAAWKFREIAETHKMELSPKLWNNIKTCLAPAIAEYIATKAMKELEL